MGLICGQQAVSVLVGFLAGLLQDILLYLGLLLHHLVDFVRLCAGVLYQLVSSLVRLFRHTLGVFVGVARHLVGLLLGFLELLLYRSLRLLAQLLSGSLVHDLVALLLCKQKGVLQRVFVIAVLTYLVGKHLQLPFKLVLVLLELRELA